jgi:ribosomal protein S16
MRSQKKFSLNNLRSSLLNKKITNSYKIGLIKVGRKRTSVFKIVSMNWDSKVIDTIGYYSPKFGFSRILAKSSFILKMGKTLVFDFKKVYFWLQKRVLIRGIFYRIIRVFNIAYVIIENNYLSTLIILDPKYNSRVNSLNQLTFFYHQIRSIDNIHEIK